MTAPGASFLIVLAPLFKIYFMLPNNLTGDELIKHFEERAKVVHSRYTPEQEAIDQKQTIEAEKWSKTANDEDIANMMIESELEVLRIINSKSCFKKKK